MLVYGRVDHCWCIPPKVSRTFLKIRRIDGRFPSHPPGHGDGSGNSRILWTYKRILIGLYNNVYTTGDLKGLHQMDISENSGTSKSSILIGFSIILNHPFWGCFPIFWKHPNWEVGNDFPTCIPFLGYIWILRVPTLPPAARKKLSNLVIWEEALLLFGWLSNGGEGGVLTGCPVGS